MIDLIIKEWKTLEVHKRDKWEFTAMIYSLAVILCGFIGLFIGVGSIIGWFK